MPSLATWIFFFFLQESIFIRHSLMYDLPFVPQTGLILAGQCLILGHTQTGNPFNPTSHLE